MSRTGMSRGHVLGLFFCRRFFYWGYVCWGFCADYQGKGVFGAFARIFVGYFPSSWNCWPDLGDFDNSKLLSSVTRQLVPISLIQVVGIRVGFPLCLSFRDSSSQFILLLIRGLTYKQLRRSIHACIDNVTPVVPSVTPLAKPTRFSRFSAKTELHQIVATSFNRRGAGYNTLEMRSGT